MGNPNVTLPQIASIFAKAWQLLQLHSDGPGVVSSPICLEAEVLQLDSLDFFAQLKTMMMRRKERLCAALVGVTAAVFVRPEDDLRPHSLKKFQHAWHMHKSRQAG